MINDNGTMLKELYITFQIPFSCMIISTNLSGTGMEEYKCSTAGLDLAERDLVIQVAHRTTYRKTEEDMQEMSNEVSNKANITAESLKKLKEVSHLNSMFNSHSHWKTGRQWK